MAERTLAVLPDPEGVAYAAARRLAALVRIAVAQRGVATLVLAGGSTPLALYRLLAAPPLREAVPWSHTHLFWGDERAVPPDAPGSNYGQAAEALLRYVPLPPANVHRMHGEQSPDAGAAAYRAELASFQRAHDPAAPQPWPRFDLVLLGLGNDGHTASLFPGSPVAAAGPVMGVTADYEGRPAERITLTPAAFNTARQVDFLVTGKGKATAVRSALQGDANPQQQPAQRIQPDAGQLTWWLDEAAAAELA
jgi:6-phosphogluconolactonase